MPEMTHPKSGQTIDVAADRVAMYASQGWREGTAPKPAKKAAKKTARKATAKKAASTPTPGA